ncbi:uncharacterized protein B0H18DRAFT_1026211 [Fomitopsis serialis]|uniref:uncharacterized protein n=1 Tax=Fomitopsis serialis TaxID=139415 RepID=UPI0020074D6C|nr:uncharacterized protein B0H18DRAFT_1026211 [Neoantrodia serialis]KAH9919923.1 hypothetical protein B0H18DRAFT_1026211 [Neoantrodia serialis]
MKLVLDGVWGLLLSRCPDDRRKPHIRITPCVMRSLDTSIVEFPKSTRQRVLEDHALYAQMEVSSFRCQHRQCMEIPRAM